MQNMPVGYRDAPCRGDNGHMRNVELEAAETLLQSALVAVRQSIRREAVGEAQVRAKRGIRNEANLALYLHTVFGQVRRKV